MSAKSESVPKEKQFNEREIREALRLANIKPEKNPGPYPVEMDPEFFFQKLRRIRAARSGK